MTEVAHAAPRRRTAWPVAAVALVALGLAVLAAPARWEGPTLLPISPGHALSLLDTIGVVPLILGMIWLHAGAWRRRTRLRHWVGERPGTGTAIAFAGGLGLGLLLASALSAFFWWWAIGAAAFLAANAIVVVAAAKGDTGEGDRG